MNGNRKRVSRGVAKPVGSRDWKNPDDYASDEALPPWRWAWEFLRRNGDYQADFEDAIGRFNAREGEYAVEKDIMDAMNDFYPPGEWVECIPSQQVHEKWLLWYYLNPELDVPGISPFTEFGPLYVWGESRRPLRDHEVLVRMDLRFPIKPQLDLARKRLERRQRTQARRGDFRRRTPRNQPDKWPRYLRLLDARAANAPYNQIAATLFGLDNSCTSDPRIKVDSTLKQARRMTQEGYRHILLHSVV